MIENDISHTFTDTVRKKFMELGFPKFTSVQLSKIILPFKVDNKEKKVYSRCDNFFYLEQIIKPYHEEIHDIVKKCWGDNFVFEIENNSESHASQTTEIVKPINIIEQKKAITKIPVVSENNVLVHQNNVEINQKNNFELFSNEPENQSVKYHFKNFIIGESNADALNACKYIIQNFGHFSEPLFIHGQTGLGKTHLLRAIENKFFSKNKNVSILYVTIPDFINDIINKGIRLGKMEEVRKKYKNCDILLVDDIQLLEKKTVCQMEFFHILNALLEKRKQLVLTSNKPPKDFKHIDARLKSRFFQGAIIEINPPTKKDRTEIIKHKSKILNLALSKDNIDFISLNLKTNIREIEGALNDILFKSIAIKDSSIEENITQTIQKRLPDVSLFQDRKQNLLFLQKTICRYFDIELSLLKTKQRHKNLALARHLAIFFAKTHLKLKSSEIIEAFERKHHKIVSYATKKISVLLNTNVEIKKYVDTLKTELL